MIGKLFGDAILLHHNEWCVTIEGQKSMCWQENMRFHLVRVFGV